MDKSNLKRVIWLWLVLVAWDIVAIYYIFCSKVGMVWCSPLSLVWWVWQ